RWSNTGCFVASRWRRGDSRAAIPFIQAAGIRPRRGGARHEHGKACRPRGRAHGRRLSGGSVPLLSADVGNTAADEAGYQADTWERRALETGGADEARTRSHNYAKR